MSVEEVVKILPVLYVSGHSEVAARLVDQLSTAELRQAVRLLASAS